jgi:hypothetical protein
LEAIFLIIYQHILECDYYQPLKNIDATDNYNTQCQTRKIFPIIVRKINLLIFDLHSCISIEKNPRRVESHFPCVFCITSICEIHYTIRANLQNNLSQRKLRVCRVPHIFLPLFRAGGNAKLWAAVKTAGRKSVAMGAAAAPRSVQNAAPRRDCHSLTCTTSHTHIL